MTWSSWSDGRAPGTGGATSAAATTATPTTPPSCWIDGEFRYAGRSWWATNRPRRSHRCSTPTSNGSHRPVAASPAAHAPPCIPAATDETGHRQPQALDITNDPNRSDPPRFRRNAVPKSLGICERKVKTWCDPMAIRSAVRASSARPGGPSDPGPLPTPATEIRRIGWMPDVASPRLATGLSRRRVHTTRSR